MRGTPLDHRCGRVAKLALERRRVQWHCPRAPSKAKRVSALVSCLFPVLACLCRGFPGSGSLVLRPCPFGFLCFLFRLMFLSTGRGHGCADTSSAQRLCRLAHRGYVRLRGMERHWDSSRAYALFSFSALATSGIRSGTLLLVPSSTTHQEDSDGLSSSVEHLRVGSEDFEGRSTTLDLTLVSLAQVSTKGDAAV